MYCGCFGRGTKYYSGDQIKKNGSGGDSDKWCIQGLGGNTEGKIPFGKLRCRLDDKNEIGLQKLGCELAWNDLAQNRDRWRAAVKEVMNFRCP